MKKTLNILIGLSSFFLLTSLNSDKVDFKKYNVESGIITYELTHFLTKEKIEQKVFFTSYGANEFFEFTNKTSPRHFSILKRDSVQYLFLSDSLAIKDQRTFDNVFEKCVFNKKSKLAFPDFESTHLSDTIYMNRECQVYEFKLTSTGQEGKAIVWNNIPLHIESRVQGLIENVVVITIDTSTDEPIYKTRLKDYVDYE